MSANHAAKLEAKFRHAQDLHQQGKRRQAAKLYRSVLNARPDHCGALHYLGLLAHQEGNGETAIRLLRSAIERQPGYFDAIMNLGNVLQEQERFAEAADCYRRAIALRPAEAATHTNLSVSLRRQERLEGAIEAGRTAVQLDPDYLIGWYNLGNAYKVAQQYNQAIACYQKAIDLKPDLTLAHDSLCQSTYQLESRSVLGRVTFSKTRKAYEQWLACEPDNALAQFMLQAIHGKEPMPRAPDAVVRSMFDQFARSFETHLEQLDYRLPRMLPALLQDLLGPPQASLAVVDGGCGTGLCAPALKPWARRLTGVDLSGAMLERARKKGLYDELFEAELTQFLQQQAGAFDVAVYADTLCYFGDLQEVLRASAQALGNRGSLLFTLEAAAAQDGSRGFRLHPSGRYTHTTAYVQQTLQACGFAQIVIRSDSMRTEVGKPVEGLVVAARKSAP
jgi:predicted TPR repeat methyltransferase